MAVEVASDAPLDSGALERLGVGALLRLDVGDGAHVPLPHPFVSDVDADAATHRAIGPVYKLVLPVLRAEPVELVHDVPGVHVVEHHVGLRTRAELRTVALMLARALPLLDFVGRGFVVED